MYYIWILLYEIIFMISEKIFVEMQVSHWITVLALLGYLCILYGWLKKTQQRQNVGLVRPRKIPLRECGYGLPLLGLPVFHVMMAQPITLEISYMMMLLCVAIIEEVFFRGFLYDRLARWNFKGYILLSALLFGAFHVVNLWEGYPLYYVIMQTWCAFTAGLCYAGLTVKTQSIVPAMIAHTLTNLSGSINGDFYVEDYFVDIKEFFSNWHDSFSPLKMENFPLISSQAVYIYEQLKNVDSKCLFYICVFFICSMIYLCYGIWLCNKIESR